MLQAYRSSLPTSPTATSEQHPHPDLSFVCIFFPLCGLSFTYNKTAAQHSFARWMHAGVLRECHSSNNADPAISVGEKP